MLAPLAVLGALSIIALLALALPKAEASGLPHEARLDPPMRLFLSPVSISSQRFLDAYGALSS